MRALSIVRPSMKRPYTMFVSPLTEGQAQRDAEGLAVLFISDPEAQSMPTADKLETLFSLSRSQAKIVYGLVLGLRLEEAAEEAGVTTSTARTYLKQAFAKTGTSRQSELIKLVLLRRELRRPREKDENFRKMARCHQMGILGG